MRFLSLTGDETPTELADAIRHLRAKQLAAVIPSTRDEYGADIDELLDMHRFAVIAANQTVHTSADP